MARASPAKPAESWQPGGGPRTLFQEDWWLEIASGGAIEKVEVVWDAITVASLSFMRHTRAGSFRSLGAPRYTNTLGPVLNLPPSKPTKHALNVQRVVRELRALLPRHDRFHQLLDPEDESAFAFSLSGCTVGQVYTFRIGADEVQDEVLARIDPTTRRLVRVGINTLGAEVHGDVDRFLRLAERERAGPENRHDFDDLARLSSACLQRGAGTFLSASDADGNDVASVFLVWDSRTLYYLLPFRDRQRSGGGANAFLIWEAIRFALGKGLIFDFDGYSSVGTARFLATFGARPLVRPVVTYRSTRCVLLDLIRGIRKPIGPSGLSYDPDVPVSTANTRLAKPRQSSRDAKATDGSATE